MVLSLSKVVKDIILVGGSAILLHERLTSLQVFGYALYAFVSWAVVSPADPLSSFLQGDHRAFVVQNDSDVILASHSMGSIDFGDFGVGGWGLGVGAGGTVGEARRGQRRGPKFRQPHIDARLD